MFQKDQIQVMCNEICKDCFEEISRVTRVIQKQLEPFSDTLIRMWSLRKLSADILESCTVVNDLLCQVSQERSAMLGSCTTVRSVVVSQ